MTDEETASVEPDYGGQTVVEYLKAELEKEAVSGRRTLEEEMAPLPPPPPAANNAPPFGFGPRPNAPPRRDKETPEAVPAER
jgi:hypothetical protein